MPNTPQFVATHVGSQTIGGGITSDRYELDVPLDWFDQSSSSSDTGTIVVSYRVVRGESSAEDKYIVYLQGGPGFASPSPTAASSGWMKAALDKKYSVVLFDQRGTGFSTAISCRSLEAVGSAADQAAYLKHFRAPSIIRDLEAVRQALGVSMWTTLGQSYGGFLTFSYLSANPEALKASMVTGGIPPCPEMGMSADVVYASTFKRVVRQNQKFNDRFPTAAAMARRVVEHLSEQEGGGVVTPAGNLLTPRSFQLLGLSCMGFSGGFEKLFAMLEAAFETDGVLSYAFLKEFDHTLAFDTNPIYAVLHESIYCSGGGATNWAADRIRSSPEYRELFDAVHATAAGKPVMFTGEMVFPWMFDEIAELRRIKGAAEIIASETEWSTLYDPDKLRSNAVPVAAAMYYEDMFVDFTLAESTVGMTNGLRTWVTNEHLHCGLREAGAKIFGKLYDMIEGNELVR